jgi:hypothetical protein
MKEEYIFPFDTCEKINKEGIAQPYSALVNAINCCIVLYFLLKTRTYHSFFLLFSVLCFGLVHCFSHMIHITGSFQRDIVHSIGYLINIAFLYAFYCYTKKTPSYMFFIYLFLLVCLDMYFFHFFSLEFYISTTSLLFVSILFYYYSLLPDLIQKNIYWIVLLIFIIVILVMNEKFNCEKMMEIYPHFPYHIFVETAGVVLFYIICNTFYRL